MTGVDLSSRPSVRDLPSSDGTCTTRGRWVEAGDLRPGDVVQTRGGSTTTAGTEVAEAPIAAVARRACVAARGVRVYNIEVAVAHTYAVGAAGVLVHNKAMPNAGYADDAAAGGGAGAAKSGVGSLDDMSRAAGAADRNGLTQAGRALQKHGDRPGSAFPQTKGGPAKLNPAGQDIVDDILTTPGSANKPNRFGGVDVIAPDGRGVRYDANGKMMGFLEP